MMDNLSPLEKLKQKLQQEHSSSELWYLRNKVQQFEHHLKSIESLYHNHLEQIFLLEEQLSFHYNPC
ncbi:MAG: hypothetical protein ACXU9U_04470 [Parachlamydiaceae bacterium]